MEYISNTLGNLVEQTAFMNLTFGNLIMIVVACVFLYLAIHHEFEPLLLVPIAFGMLLVNIYPDIMLHAEDAANGTGGLLYYFYQLDEWSILPSLIFLGVGAMTDFGPLLARPSVLLLGAAAQVGVFVALAGAMLLGFNVQEAGAIRIIGGADGPTAIYLSIQMAPHLLGAIAVAAYSYMSLVPLIQPPIMKLLTTQKEREVVMEQLRPVTRFERVCFPIAAAIIISLLLPPIASLLGCLMLGNLFRESGVMDRLSDTAQNSLCNIVTIFLATGTGMTMNADDFLVPQTLLIIALGLVAFIAGTAGGVLFGKVMCRLSGWKINPLIGSAGVSAVPMAARVSQVVGMQAKPGNYLLMHAMGPNVAGVIGTAVAAGTMLAMLK